MESAIPEIPRKDFYKLNEVCQYTDTQPYVLRFWESEFPQLSPTKRGHGRLYSRSDIELVQRIKELLYDEEYTIASAREQIEQERSGKRSRKSAAARGRQRPKAEPRTESAPQTESRSERAASSAAEALTEVPIPKQAAPRLPLEDEAPLMIPRERYDNAVDEIEHLRFQLRDAEKAQHKAEASLERREHDIEELRRRSHGAQARLEQILSELDDAGESHA